MKRAVNEVLNEEVKKKVTEEGQGGGAVQEAVTNMKEEAQVELNVTSAQKKFTMGRWRQKGRSCCITFSLSGRIR